MTIALIRKLLRDIRLSLVVVCLFLAGFQCLWAKITQRIAGELVPFFAATMGGADKLMIPLREGSLGRLMEALMGGQSIGIDNAMDMMSIGYVHPLMQTVFCIWAVGRASGAIAGEIDRGTMELLLAQPLSRYRLILAHLCVDLLTIPLLCLSLWGGTWLGTWMVSPIQVRTEAIEELKQKMLPFPVPQQEMKKGSLDLYPASFGPALLNVGALIFAVSGYTMWLSAVGRFRWRVLGIAVFITLVQFLINVVGQLWDAVAFLRPFTVFYYYQPQQIILNHRWTTDVGNAWNSGQPLWSVNVIVVLIAVGVVGYAMALWTFCRRDLPAPL